MGTVQRRTEERRGDVDVFDVAARLLTDVWPRDLVWGVHHSTPSAVESLRLWPSIDDPQALTMYDGRNVCDLVVRRTNAGYEAAADAVAWAERQCESRALRVGRRIADPRLIELLVERGFRRRRLPQGTAAAIVEFMLGALLDNPHRLGGELQRELAGLRSARRGAYRIIDEIDDSERLVIVYRIEHRATVYRPR